MGHTFDLSLNTGSISPSIEPPFLLELLKSYKSHSPKDRLVNLCTIFTNSMCEVSHMGALVSPHESQFNPLVQTNHAPGTFLS